jgi:hypothetical protein
MLSYIRASVVSFMMAALGMAVSAPPSFAITAPAMRITDGTDTVTIDSTGTVTFSPGCVCTTLTPPTGVAADHEITWAGKIGNFSIAGGFTGKPKAFYPATIQAIDIESGGITNTGASAATLTVSWSDTGFTGIGASSVTALTSFSGAGTANYTAYTDPSNTLFGEAPPAVASASLSNTPSGIVTTTGAAPASEPFSLTLTEAITLNPGETLANDFNVQVTIVPPVISYLVKYAANLNIGESYIDITNTGANGCSLLGPGYGTTSGNICANVYAFDPGEELISCCSCLVTCDQTVSLGVNSDLTAKTLTGVVPTSVTVKVLSSLAGGDGTGTSCTNSAAAVTSARLAGGLAAWGTTLHATPAAGRYDTTEAPFTGSTLSQGELNSIGGRCAFILGNGGGFGVCKSCRAGTLGALPLRE